MSKPNKANRNNYSQAGRLTPDEHAREQVKMRGIKAKERGERAANRRQTGRG